MLKILYEKILVFSFKNLYTGAVAAPSTKIFSITVNSTSRCFVNSNISSAEPGSCPPNYRSENKQRSFVVIVLDLLDEAQKRNDWSNLTHLIAREGYYLQSFFTVLLVERHHLRVVTLRLSSLWCHISDKCDFVSEATKIYGVTVDVGHHHVKKWAGGWSCSHHFIARFRTILQHVAGVIGTLASVCPVAAHVMLIIRCSASYWCCQCHQHSSGPSHFP